MAENNKRRKVRSESMALDAMHIIIGIAVVVMSVISFLDTERYMFLFPVIFFLAAVLNLATGKYWLLPGQSGSGGEELRRCSRWDSERSC